MRLKFILNEVDRGKQVYRLIQKLFNPFIFCRSVIMRKPVNTHKGASYVGRKLPTVLRSYYVSADSTRQMIPL